MVGYFLITQHKNKLLGDGLQILVKVICHDLNNFEHNFFFLFLFETLLWKFGDVLDQQQSKLYDLVLIQNPEVEEFAKGLQVHVEGTVNDFVDDRFFSYF